MNSRDSLISEMVSHVIRVPIHGTLHELVLIGECDCVKTHGMPPVPPVCPGAGPSYYKKPRDAYLAFLYHFMRRYIPDVRDDGERYWAVHWGDAHVIAVKDRSAAAEE